MYGKDSRFRVEKEEDKEEMREIREENISFPFILWGVILFPLKRAYSKNEVSFQNWHVLARGKNWISNKGVVDGDKVKETAFIDKVERHDSSPTGSIYFVSFLLIDMFTFYAFV